MHQPADSCFCQVLDEYQKNFGESWKTVQADSSQPWPYLNESLSKFQVLLLSYSGLCLKLPLPICHIRISVISGSKE